MQDNNTFIFYYWCCNEHHFNRISDKWCWQLDLCSWMDERTDRQTEYPMLSWMFESIWWNPYVQQASSALLSTNHKTSTGPKHVIAFRSLRAYRVMEAGTEESAHLMQNSIVVWLGNTNKLAVIHYSVHRSTVKQLFHGRCNSKTENTDARLIKAGKKVKKI